jgi:hypothetical protein
MKFLCVNGSVGFLRGNMNFLSECAIQYCAVIARFGEWNFGILIELVSSKLSSQTGKFGFTHCNCVMIRRNRVPIGRLKPKTMFTKTDWGPLPFEIWYLKKGSSSYPKSIENHSMSENQSPIIRRIVNWIQEISSTFYCRIYWHSAFCSLLKYLFENSHDPTNEVGFFTFYFVFVLVLLFRLWKLALLNWHWAWINFCWLSKLGGSHPQEKAGQCQ